ELAHLKEIPTTSKLSPVDAAAILEAVASGFLPDAEAKGLDLRVQIQASPTILAQPGHLRSLWKHLIDNAIRYTSRGQITVTLDEQDGRVVTSVTDSGIGVSTDELSRIFEEFYRADSAREKVELGTGLGLPIVNQVVKVPGLDPDRLQSGEGQYVPDRSPACASRPRCVRSAVEY
ncbi:MAG: hypothetical protein GWN58_44440, partial [Anaerolineae bacterium]|nr:hypothetical protein [Anaerolineae bacterium]